MNNNRDYKLFNGVDIEHYKYGFSALEIALFHREISGIVQ